MSRIAATFARLRAEGGGRKGLVVYLTAGDPRAAETPLLVLAAARAGADVVELGIPFSDPTADGPVIQAAMERALRGGMRLATVFEQVKAVRRASDVPLVLFGYVNPILQYGPVRFARDAADAGADGVLVVDLPIEEAGEVAAPARAAGLDYVALVAPTSTPARVACAAEIASGFVYVIARTGVTGAGAAEFGEVARVVADLRVRTPLPVAVGFGVQTPEDARAAAAQGDAAVVGSALVRVVAEAPSSQERIAALARAVAELQKAIG